MDDHTFTAVDLHVHSKYSKRPTFWVLQKLGCPESFTEPKRLYDIAVKKGMSLITITDHNCIGGCLEIAHLPGVFMSEEVTAHFPHDGCKIHVLVYNITEARHQEIQRLRKNVFDLLKYLDRENLFYSLAHALYPVNDLLTQDRFEQLLLLFQNFELNGAREAGQNVVLKNILRSLTESKMNRLMDRHGIVPGYPRPWVKNLTGGSDDHSSLNIADTHTRVPGTLDIEGFFNALRSGCSEVRGEGSSPLHLAHNIYGIGYQYYAQKAGLERHADKDRFLGFLNRSLQPATGEQPSNGMFSRFCGFWRSKKNGLLSDTVNMDLKVLLQREGYRVIHGHPELMDVLSGNPGAHQSMEKKWLTFVNEVSNGVLRQFADRFLGNLQKANVFNVFQSIGSAGGLYTLLAPYFIAYSAFSRGRAFSRQVEQWGPGEHSTRDEKSESVHVGHFTDTLYEINGVALTLRQQAIIAGKTDKNLKVITCGEEKGQMVPTIRNFEPIGVYELPEYPEQKLLYPPFLEMLGYCYNEGFTHIHSATPGPIGLAALGIARILKLPIYGTYHTALPQYARFLTDDAGVEDLVWRYTLWYYDQMDSVFVPSVSTARELTSKGISRTKIRLFPRGIDIRRFNPSVQNGYFRKNHPAPPAFQLLYVGRVSREKGLPLLEAVFKSLLEADSTDNPLRLVVVGDGPYLEEMCKNMEGLPCTFTGYLEGDDLVSVYNSCDLFVFPSATDTFGNVVLEAQACGLPAIVTDQGGPRENLVEGETGLVVDADSESALQSAIQSLMDDPLRLRKMSRACRRYMEERSFEMAFNDTWNMYGDKTMGTVNILDEAV